jgi:four helix bundle protein
MAADNERSISRNYRDLIVWREGIKLAKMIYSLTGKFPRQELYGLTDQIRRASVSVPSNIAEGQARRQPGQFRHALHIALGSLAEVDTQLVLALEFGYLNKVDLAEVEALITELRKKIYTLINSLPEH